MSNFNWPKYKLSSLTSRIGDGIHGTPIYVEESNYAFINGNNLKHGFIQITAETKKVSASEFKKNFIEFDDKTLFLSINGTLGSLAKYRGEAVILGKSAAYIKCSTVNVDYLYYYLQLGSIQEYLWNVATGSTIKNLSLASIRNLEIPTPSDEDQRKIALVLSTIDAKIHCNNQINEKLESMAKLLYDYWFIQFDFPDENGNPYKSSGGEMVFNELLKRNIPKDWVVTKFGNYAEVTKGDLITAKDAIDGDIKVVAAGIDYSYKHSNFNRPKNTITISGSGANAGYVNFWREPIFASDCITVRGNTDAVTILLLQYLRFIQPYIYSQATGSAQPHVYPSDIKNLDYVLADEGIIKKFGDIAIPINNLIAKNINENEHLTHLRDWLLPMLMNGQVTIT